MNLDRNINENGRGKYALVKMRELTALEKSGDFSATSAVSALAMRGIVDYGNKDETDFFVIRLKDKYAAPALAAYAMAAYRYDRQYAMDVLNLAKAAGEMIPANPT